MKPIRKNIPLFSLCEQLKVPDCEGPQFDPLKRQSSLDDQEPTYKT